MARNMAKKSTGTVVNRTCCAPGTCRVEAVVSVDDRGQMVLPKDLRERAGLRAGEKLAVVSCDLDGQVCCLTLLKAADLSASLKATLGPMLSEIFA